MSHHKKKKSKLTTQSFERRSLRRAMWSGKSVFLLVLIDVALCTFLVFAFSHKTLFAETELSLALVAASLFVFLTIGLYRGVRIRKERPSTEMPGPLVNGPKLENFDFDPSGAIDAVDFGAAGEGCLVAIVGAIVGVIGLIVLTFFAWIFINAAWIVLAVLAVALYYVFYAALRRILVLSRVTRGNIAKSLGYALAYSVLYTGWLFGLVWIIHWVTKR